MVVSTPDIINAPKSCNECPPVEVSHDDGSKETINATYPAGVFIVGLTDYDGQVLASVECPNGHQRVIDDPEIIDFPRLAELVENLDYLSRSIEAARREELKKLHTSRQDGRTSPHTRHAVSY